MRACRELGEPDACVPLTPKRSAARCDSPVFRGGAFYPRAATVQPARLARGLRAAGARRAGWRSTSSTTIGSVTAAKAARSSPRPSAARSGRRRRCSQPAAPSPACRRMNRRLTLTSSHMVITEPVPELLEEIGWTGGECITDSRAMVHYFRTTPDGRIAFGWGGGASSRRPHQRPRRARPGGGSPRSSATCAFLPRARGAADRSSLGRADRRLSEPPAGRRRARAGHPLRLRLHRPRCRPLEHGRPLARLAGARSPRRAQPPGVCQPAGRCRSRPSPSATSAARSSGARSCARRRRSSAVGDPGPLDPRAGRDPGAHRDPRRALAGFVASPADRLTPGGDLRSACGHAPAFVLSQAGANRPASPACSMAAFTSSSRARCDPC